jgi:hypothetical protein
MIKKTRRPLNTGFKRLENFPPVRRTIAVDGALCRVLGATRRINRITLFQAAMGPQIQFASESFIDKIAATIAATLVAFRLLSDRAARHRHRQGRRPGQRARLRFGRH